MAKGKKRSARAKPTKLPFSAEWMRQLTRPVPPDVFAACVQLYQAAAMFRSPVKNPNEYKIRMKGQLFGLSDIPMNRGMVAIKEFLRGSQEDLLPAVATRTMAFTMMLQDVHARKDFAVFFRTGTEADGSWMISEALLEAFASAPFVADSLTLEVKALHRIASEILAADPPSLG
jgi:hypothetical protein